MKTSFLLASCLMLSATADRAQERQQPPPAEASLAPPKVFYSQVHWFRIVYPDDVERHYVRDDIAPRKFERENFEIKSPDGAVLYGRVSGEAGNTAPPDQLIETNLDGLKNGRFRDSRESEGWAEGQQPPQFKVTLRVVKSDWYVYSGIQGASVFYEKGLTGFTVCRLHLQYPVAAKRYFDPIVARIANSLEPYLYFRAKVWMLDRRENGGVLWFELEPDAPNNHRTVCYFTEHDADQFAKLEQGEVVTVAGKPDSIVIREPSDDWSGLYETSIKSCVLAARVPVQK